MSRTASAAGAAVLFCALLAGCGDAPEREAPFRAPITVTIPAHRAFLGSRELPASLPVQRVESDPFVICRTEITVEEYAQHLRSLPDPPPHPQIVRDGDLIRPAHGERDRPIAYVSAEDAAAYCRWLSRRTGRRWRLPTEREWEIAARGGIHGAPYPWGWGPPAGRAQFRSEKSAATGTYAANPFGLFDVAGNVFEWCTPANGIFSPGIAPVRGGSWAESSASMLHVARRVLLPVDYRDADTGFRPVCEMAGRNSGSD